jgi:hypothetical protein
MTPRKRITDPTFVYRDSAHTDIRKTFARIRAQQRADAAEAQTKVEPIAKRRAVA